MSLDEAIARAAELAARLGEHLNEVRKQARADDKTPLLNAHALNDATARFGAPEEPDVVVFGDLKGFKRLNDEHGHVVGDAALNYIGQLIDTIIVKGCKGEAYRRSGDEFVFLLHQRSVPSFLQAQAAFAQCSFFFNGNIHSVSINFGYAIAADGQAALGLMTDRAEAACKNAKLQQVTCVLWSEDLQQAESENRRFRCPSCSAINTCDQLKAKLPQRFTCMCCQSPLA